MAYTEKPMMEDAEIETYTELIDNGFWPRLTLEDIVGSRQVDEGTVGLVKQKYDGISSPERIAESGYFPKDRIKRYEETLYIEQRGLGFDIPEKTLQIYRATGNMINAKYITGVGRRLAESIEDVSLARMQTLAAAVTPTANTFDVVSDTSKGAHGVHWDAASCEPYNDVLAMLKLLDKKGYDGNVLWVDKGLFRDLQKKDTAGSIGQSWMSQIQSLGIDVEGSFRLSMGTGVLFDRSQMEYVYSKKPTFRSDFNIDNGMFKCVAFYEGVLDIEDIDACLTLQLGANS